MSFVHGKDVDIWLDGRDITSYFHKIEFSADADLADLPTLDDAALDVLAGRLGAFEAEVSGRRQQLHVCIDTLQNEIKRRYGEGEATVDSLLS